MEFVIAAVVISSLLLGYEQYKKIKDALVIRKRVARLKIR